MAKLTTEQIARVAHEVNRQYVIGLRDRTTPPTHRLGGIPLPPPAPEPEPVRYDDELPAYQMGLMDGVQAVLDNPKLAPGEIHQKWLISKQAQGWRYGPKKDPIRMEHPNITAFDTLPAAEQTKDYIFRAVVLSLGEIEVGNELDKAIEEVKEHVNAITPGAISKEEFAVCHFGPDAGEQESL